MTESKEPTTPEATASLPAADQPAAAESIAPADPPQPHETTALVDYIRSNRDAYTEDALRRAAIAAGNAPADVEAALLAARGDGAPTVDRGRAVRNVFLWYLGVFVVLSVLMGLNPANASGGFLGDTRGLGIFILGLSLGAAYIASLVWIASRRAFIALLGAGVVLTGISTVTSNPAGTGIIAAVVYAAIGIVIIVAAARVGARPGVPARPSMELLMVLPMLMLLAVGGVCVASVLPIPRTV